MRSLSSIVRSSHVILDNKKFLLSSKIINTGAELESAPAVPHETTAQMADSIIKKAIDEADSIIENAMDEAQSKIVNANAEAERIMADAMDQAKLLRDKSFSEGLEQGKQEGFNEGRDIAEAIIQEALEIKNQALLQYAQLLDSSETEIVDLILDITQKVLNKELESPDYIVGLVKSAIDKCTYTQQVVLRVSEDDFDYVIMQKDKIIVLCENVDDIEVKVDRSFTRGSCVVESISGNIDSSIQTQMDYIENRFRELLISE